jgi:glycosyltransferase involved in cell wall biosynthesis
MRILRVHNYYLQPGGEDESFHTEIGLLESREHEVIRHTVRNDRIVGMTKGELVESTFWSRRSYRELSELIRIKRPDIAHFDNIFPLISPSAYYATHSMGIPVIQNLRNFRLVCPGTFLFREGKVCEDCLGRVFAWPGVAHACYRDRRVTSMAVASLVAIHRLLGTWKRKVDRYIAATEFLRMKHVEGGIPADKIVVKPNFVDPDPGVGSGGGGYALFVGRLSPEKGLKTMLTAWETLHTRLPLKIVGDGPLRDEVVEAAGRLGGVRWLGRQARPAVIDLMKRADLLITPSQWYEGCTRVVIEAFAVGLPVVSSELGSMKQIVSEGFTGIHFTPGDPVDLAEKIEGLVSQPRLLEKMRAESRAEYERRYTPEKNYRMLISIYEGVLAAR